MNHKTLNALCGLVAGGVLSVSPVMADAETDDYYLLPQLAYIAISLDRADPLYAAGFVLGWRITNNVSVSGEVYRSFAGGEFSRRDSSGQTLHKASYQMQAQAVYGSYRLPLTLSYYAKVKAGLVYEQIQRRDAKDKRRATQIGISSGVGLGYRASPLLTLEVDGVSLESSIVMLSFGCHYQWQ